MPPYTFQYKNNVFLRVVQRIHMYMYFLASFAIFGTLMPHVQHVVPRILFIRVFKYLRWVFCKCFVVYEFFVWLASFVFILLTRFYRYTDNYCSVDGVLFVLHLVL